MPNYSSPPAKDAFTAQPAIETIQQSTVRSWLVTVAGRGGAQLIQLLGLVILARILAPEDFGLVAMVMAAIGVANIFKDLGLSAATIRAPSITVAQISSLFYINVLFGGLMSLLAWVIGPLLADFYSDPRITELTRVLAWVFLLSGFGTQHMALMRRRLQFGRLAWLSIISTLAGQLCAVVLAWQGHGYWSLAVGLLLTTVMNSLLAWLCCDWRPGRPVYDTELRQMLSFGGYMVVFVLLGYLALQAQNVMIGWMYGATLVGLYSRAFFLLTMLVSYVLEPLNLIVPAGLSALQDNPEAYRKHYLDLFGMLLLLAAPIGCICAVLGPELIEVLLGAKWQAAGTVLVILALGVIPQVICASSGWLYMSHGNARAMMQWGIGGWSALLLFMLAGLPFGINGIATGYSVGMLLLVYPCMRLAFRRTTLTFSDLVTTGVGIVSAAVLAGLLLVLLLHSLSLLPLARLLIGLLVYGVVYLLLLVYVFRQGQRLQDFFNQLLKRPTTVSPSAEIGS